jgi:hypothetical protein
MWGDVVGLIEECGGMCRAVFDCGIFLCEVFTCNYLFNCRLEFRNVVLREIFGGKMEKLTGGCGKL